MIRYCYIESIFFCANQARVPGFPAFALFNDCCLILSMGSNVLESVGEFLIALIINLGLLILNNFNQNISPKMQIKKPILNTDNISTNKNLNDPSNDINGIKNQQVKNLINRTLGKYLAYFKSCSGVISHSSGMELALGKVFHNLSLKEYKRQSIVKLTIGYVINSIATRIFFLLEATTRKVTINFSNIANSPDPAIIFGFSRKFLKCTIIPQIFLNLSTQWSETPLLYFSTKRMKTKSHFKAGFIWVVVMN